MQGRNEDTDVENGLVDTVEEGERGMNGKGSTDGYTLSCAKQTAGGKLMYNTQSSA